MRARAAVAQPQIRGGLPPCLCECGRSQGRYWLLAGILQHGAPAPEPGLSHAAANLPGRPVDMWTIGVADLAALPPLPERARKAGKCSPSPTYPQAPQSTKRCILMIRKAEALHQLLHRH